MRRFIILLTLATMLASPFAVSASYNKNSAESYLVAHRENPWSTMALSIIDADNISSDYLKSVSGSSAIEFAAPILAITALNEDPRTFGDKDLVSELEAFHTDNQIGDDSTINDDIFGLLALLSAGLAPSNPTITDAKNFIISHQQANGGWGFGTNGGTDSNTTAAAIVALTADGISQNNAIIQNGLNYLKTTQNDDGGFTYDPESQWGTDSDSSSTAWVMWALNSASENLSDWVRGDSTPQTYLESNQDPIGFFKYQNSSSEDAFSATTTAYTVIALSGNTLPVNVFTPKPTHHSGGGGSSSDNNDQITDNNPTPVPTGQVLAAISFAEGTLVKTADNPTVYIVVNDKFRPFSNEATFYAHGLKFSDVQIIESNVITSDNVDKIME